MPLVAATGNSGKLLELRRLLKPLDLVGPSEIDLKLEVDEHGQTFLANAMLKAIALASASGLICLADDSGLEVEALSNAPGVFSARYGGSDLNDADRCRYLLRQLQKVKGRQRQARIRCCVVAVGPDGRTCSAEGICHGRIADAPVGMGGFGYDPVFYLPEHNQTMAELAPHDKDEISHRGQAIRLLYPKLLHVFPELTSTT